MKRLLCCLALLLAFALHAQDFASKLVPLIDPSKLATIGPRGANPRIQKCVYWLEQARLAGQNPTNVVHETAVNAGYKKAAAALTEQSLLRNLDIATKLGCLDEAGLAKMRRGGSPVVHKGPYAGDIASVDHIIPRAVVPELDNVIANLELLPLKLNESKNSKIGDRQRDMAKRFHAAGLLSDAGLRAVQSH